MKPAITALGLVCALVAGLPAAGEEPSLRDVHLRGALGSVAEVLDAFEGPDSLRVETDRISPIGRHSRGRQYRDGVPIDGTWFALHSWRGSVRRGELRLADLPGAPETDPLPRSEAVRVAEGHLAGSQEILSPRVERLLVRGRDRLRDVWRVHLLTAEGPRMIDVDTSTGAVLSVQDGGTYETPTATVFDPNPVVALRDASLRQPGLDSGLVDTDLDDSRLTGALVKLPMNDLDQSLLAQGRLAGPWVDVQGPAPLTMGTGGFTYTRSDPRFEATMAYAHIDRIQRYLQTLRFGNLNAEPQRVYALPLQGFDNSMYVSGVDAIILGSGGVDDGEDAEVIIHEYGHAVQDDQVPGWGRSNEAGAMGEGWGDFLAAAFFARTSSNGFQDTCVADWDATSYSREDPPCLRRLDTSKRYPQDLENEVHADGEIWSAFLWQLRQSLGVTRGERTDNALRLVLTSHELLAPDAGFKDAVAALQTAARRLGRSDWIPLVQDAARARGF